MHLNGASSHLIPPSFFTSFNEFSRQSSRFARSSTVGDGYWWKGNDLYLFVFFYWLWAFFHWRFWMFYIEQQIWQNWAKIRWLITRIARSTNFAGLILVIEKTLVRSNGSKVGSWAKWFWAFLRTSANWEISPVRIWSAIFKLVNFPSPPVRNQYHLSSGRSPSSTEKTIRREAEKGEVWEN